MKLDKIGAIALAGLLSLPLTAQAQNVAPPAPPDVETTVTLYSSVPSQTGELIKTAFEKAYPNIKLNMLQLTSAPLFSRFAGEVESGTHSADVFLSGSALLYLKSPELFQNIRELVPTTAKIPANVLGDNSSYVNISVSPFVAGINTAQVSKGDIEQNLKSWKQLATPYWKGKLITMDPRATTVYMAWYSKMRETYGDDWLRGVASNAPTIADSGAGGAQQVAAGAYDMVYPVAQTYILNAKSKGAPVELLFPEGPTVGISTSLALPKQAPHPKAALLFANFMLSPVGQSVECAAGAPVIADGTPADCLRLSASMVPAKDTIPDAEQKVILQLLGIRS